jgi:hypothetical protein
VLAIVLGAAVGYSLVPPTWPGVAVGVAILTLTGVVVTHWSRSAHWDARRFAAVAGAAVVARALVGFASVSEMTPRPPGGFVQNTVLLVLSLALVVAATRPRRRGAALTSGPCRPMVEESCQRTSSRLNG